jgi:hypothetical protein
MICKHNEKMVYSKQSEENMLSAEKTVNADGKPLEKATKTNSVPRNTLQRQAPSNVEILKFGQCTTFTKAEQQLELT